MMGGEHIFLSKLILGSEINVASTEDKAKEKRKVFGYVLLHAG